MRLVQVSDNVFVNPDSISCVEQRSEGGVYLTYVWIGEKSYVLTVPFDEFYKDIEEPVKMVQNFAG